MQLVEGLNPGDPEGDGNVRYTHDMSVHVLNSKLKLLATYKVASLWENASGLTVAIANADHDPRPELLVFAKDKVLVLKFR